MTMKMILAATATLVLLSAGVTHAQPQPAAKPVPAATAAKPSATAKPAATVKPRTAKSLECSKEADAKGLHGKERRKFRSECKKG